MSESLHASARTPRCSVAERSVEPSSTMTISRGGPRLCQRAFDGTLDSVLRVVARDRDRNERPDSALCQRYQALACSASASHSESVQRPFRSEPFQGIEQDSRPRNVPPKEASGSQSESLQPTAEAPVDPIVVELDLLPPAADRDPDRVQFAFALPDRTAGMQASRTMSVGPPTPVGAAQELCTFIRRQKILIAVEARLCASPSPRYATEDRTLDVSFGESHTSIYRPLELEKFTAHALIGLATEYAQNESISLMLRHVRQKVADDIVGR